MTPSAAQMNAHIRDNLNFLYSAPACRVYNRAAISIANATWTALTFNSERFDNNTMHSTSSNTGRITFTTAGRYLLTFAAEFAANATGFRQISMDHSVTVGIASETVPVVSAAAATAMDTATHWACAAAEYATAFCYQTSGGNLNVNSSAAYSPEFMAHWMGN